MVAGVLCLFFWRTHSHFVSVCRDLHIAVNNSQGLVIQECTIDRCFNLKIIKAMPGKSASSRVKNPEQYEALRDKGYSKEKSARIANTPNSGTKGGHAAKYEEKSKKELYQKAKELGIEGRSKMSKQELIHALRNN